MSAPRLLRSAIATAIMLAFAPLASAQNASYDPPDRVVRLAYQTGDVEFASAGEDNWGSADVNRPLVTGDRLETGRNGRVALELGDASVRINDDSAFNLLNLDSQTAQFELSQGTLSFRVRAFAPGQTYEVDTPTVAFVASQRGNYRVDVAPDGNGSIVTVFSGAGIVYGENGVSRQVVAGRSYRFDDSQLSSVTARRIPAPDAFDRFCSNRDTRYARSISRRYVAPDVIGYDDLDGYGDWRASADYGEVWYPNRVASDWAPYHDGYWAWIDPWGWSWVDNAPWGFAPSHYGRWAYIDDRWGWIPGPMRSHAVYAPALVVFIGGAGFSIGISGGEPVGWFPLGPRDIYQPWYPVSRNYFTSINVNNVRIVNNTIINNTYNNYITNSPGSSITYANRNVPGAVTVVPRNVFTGARPVAPATLQINPQTLAQAKVMPSLRVTPNIASLGVRPGARPTAEQTQQFTQPVIARHPPPAPPVPFAERVKVIANQGGAPLAPAQMHDLRQARANERHAPPRVVMAAPGGGAVNPVATRAETTARPETRTPPNVPRVPDAQAQPTHPGELPSARFTHPHDVGAQAGNSRPTAAVQANDAGQNAERPPQPPRRNAQEQPPRNPQADNTRTTDQGGDRGFVRAPRTDAQAPRVQDAQERPARTNAGAPQQGAAEQGRVEQAQPPQPHVQRAPREEPRMAPTPEAVPAPREQQPQHRDVRVPRAQDVEQPLPSDQPREVRAPQRRDAQAPRVQEQPLPNDQTREVRAPRHSDAPVPQERPMRQRPEPPVVQAPPAAAQQRPEPRVKQAEHAQETPEQRKKRLQDEKDQQDLQDQQDKHNQ